MATQTQNAKKGKNQAPPPPQLNEAIDKKLAVSTIASIFKGLGVSNADQLDTTKGEVTPELMKAAKELHGNKHSDKVTLLLVDLAVLAGQDEQDLQTRGIRAGELWNNNHDKLLAWLGGNAELPEKRTC